MRVQGGNDDDDDNALPSSRHRFPSLLPRIPVSRLVGHNEGPIPLVRFTGTFNVQKSVADGLMQFISQ